MLAAVTEVERVVEARETLVEVGEKKRGKSVLLKGEAKMK